VFLGVETRHFGHWICFRPQVKGGEDTYWSHFWNVVFILSETRTMEKVQEASNY
jgi:hypothetical protein